MIYEYLNDKEVEAVNVCVDGCDVKSYLLASMLREIEIKMENNNDDFLVITDVMGEYGVNESLPYFGAIAVREVSNK